MSSNRSVEHRILASRCLLLAGASLVASCSFFSRQPPLPRQAAIESTIAGDEKLGALVRNADIIYFPSESVTLAVRSEAAWKLLEALQQSGGSFALGWDSIAGEEQPVLDEWARRAASSDHVMPRFHFHAGSSDQENCRAFLRQANGSGARILALRRPSALLPAQSSEEFAAARIAEYFREHRSEKMLVFITRDQLGRNHGVPYFVAQKTKARQLVLNPQQTPAPRSRLLAWNWIHRLR